MPHKYLNEIGIESTDICVFNTEKTDNESQEYFIKQRQMYGFDEREIFSMDYTFATWLYEHLQVYKELCKDIINLEYHTFLIPILYPIPDDKLIYIDKKETYAQQYMYEEIEKHTELEAINIMIDYLKEYLTDTYKEEQIKTEYLQGAIGILKEVIPALWW